MSELFAYDTSPFKLSQMSVSTLNYEDEYNRLKKEVIISKIIAKKMKIIRNFLFFSL